MSQGLAVAMQEAPPAPVRVRARWGPVCVLDLERERERGSVSLRWVHKVRAPPPWRPQSRFEIASLVRSPPAAFHGRAVVQAPPSRPAPPVKCAAPVTRVLFETEVILVRCCVFCGWGGPVMHETAAWALLMQLRPCPCWCVRWFTLCTENLSFCLHHVLWSNLAAVDSVVSTCAVG